MSNATAYSCKMVYSFRMGSRRTAPWAVHDPLLGPVLRAATGTPYTVALAVAVKAVATGIPPGITRAWLTHRAQDGPLRDLASDRAAWTRIWLIARRHVSSSSSHPQRARLARLARLAVARRLVGHLYRPLDATPNRQLAARTVSTLVATRILNRGGEQQYATLLVGASDVAVALGVSRLTARAWLRAACDLDMLTERQHRPGGMSVWALRRLTPEAGLVAAGHADLIDLLAASDDDPDLPPEIADDITAGLVLGVDHPAWRYAGAERDGIGPQAWLAASAYSQGVDPRIVGVPARRLAEVRARLAEMGVVDLIAGGPSGDVAACLDAYASSIGAGGRAGAAQAKRAAEVAVRKASLDQHRRAAAVVDRLLDQAALPLPPPTATKPKRDTWAAAVRQAAGEGVDPEIGAECRRVLVTRMLRRGYGREVASRVAEVLLRDRPSSDAVA